MSSDTEMQKKLSQRRNKILFILLLILSIGIFFFVPLIFKSMYPAASEISIRKAAAAQLHKDPNELTKKDFAKIEVLIFRNETGLSDLNFLRKFINLKELRFLFLQPSPFQIPADTPRWKVFLSKLGIINIPKTYVPPWRYEKRIIDIRGLEKLPKLERLDLSGTSIQSVDSLGYLKNLKALSVSYTDISGLEPIKKLRNLQELNLTGCKNIAESQIQDLQSALPDLKISDRTYTPPWVKNSSNENGTEK